MFGFKFTVQPLSSSLRTALLMLTVMASFVIQIRGEIRCYCNLPVCVTTGYMCKSAQNACFTEHFAFTNDLSQSRHGCLELLHGHKKLLCLQLAREQQTGTKKVQGVSDQATEAKDHSTSFPSVFCCQEDMCNYISAMDIHVHVQSKNNRTHGGPGNNGEDRSSSHYPGGEPVSFPSEDLWFKAAVIAVPIAGSFILVLLILLAAHMLKQDSRRQRHLTELRRQRQFKTRLLLGESYPEKSAAYHHCHHGHYSAVAYAADCDLVNPDMDVPRHTFVYERPVSVSLCGSLLPLARPWETPSSKAPAYV